MDRVAASVRITRGLEEALALRAAVWPLGSLDASRTVDPRGARNRLMGVQHRWGDPVPAAPALWLILPQLLIMLIVGGGQEEIGWRGWLQPAVRARTGRWQTPLVVAAIWFCWHLPLWWTPGAIQNYLPMPTFAMMIVGMSLLLARTLEATNGRPAVAIWLHALNNLAAGWLIFVTPAHGAAQPGSWAMGISYVAVGVGAMLVRPVTPGERSSFAARSRRGSTRA